MVAFGLLLATVAIWPEGFLGVTFDGTAAAGAAATAAFDEGRGLPWVWPEPTGILFCGGCVVAVKSIDRFEVRETMIDEHKIQYSGSGEDTLRKMKWNRDTKIDTETEKKTKV